VDRIPDHEKDQKDPRRNQTYELIFISLFLMKKKYLLLYVPAGGGHVSTAKGIAKYFQENYADSVDADVVDGFQ